MTTIRNAICDVHDSVICRTDHYSMDIVFWSHGKAGCVLEHQAGIARKAGRSMERFGNGKVRAAVSVMALLAGLALCGIAGCATDEPAVATRQTGDAAITAGVQAALLGDASLKASEIDVDTDQGVVRLSGFVGSADDVAAAAAAARTVKGVRSVRNELRLK